MEDLKVKYGFAPTAKQNKSLYDGQEMFKYYKEYQHKISGMNVLWRKYEESVKNKDSNTAQSILLQYNTLKDGITSLQERYMSSFKESYNQQLNNPMYKLRESGLRTLLDVYKQSNGTISDKIIAKACAEYMSANPPTQLPVYVSVNQVQSAV